MNRQQRIDMFDRQSRAFMEGTVEYINDQWIFFDDETEEASLLDEFIHQEIEIYKHKRWRKGILFENGRLELISESVFLEDQSHIRIRKNLVYALELLLDEINDDAFVQFVSTLNSLKFSIFDCIYCHNHLSFLRNDRSKNGVNFMIFDNGEHICSVQHHFCYVEKAQDRFEFTLNCGKRLVIEKLTS